MKLREFSMNHEVRGAPNVANAAIEKRRHASVPAFEFEHVRDVARRAIAEKLAASLLVVGDAMLFYQGDEVRGRISSQSGFREMRVWRDEIIRLRINVREVTASAAGDKNFLACAVRALDDRNPAPSLAGLDRAEQSGSACAQNQYIKLVNRIGYRGAPSIFTAGFIPLQKIRLRRTL